MTQREPNLVHSSLSGRVSRDGITVDVFIVRLEHEPGWTLEVVNASNTSIVWDDVFASDDAAYAEFQRTLDDEGIRTFLDQGNVVPFKR